MKSVVHVPRGSGDAYVQPVGPGKKLWRRGWGNVPLEMSLPLCTPGRRSSPYCLWPFCDAEIAAGLITNFAGVGNRTGPYTGACHKGKKSMPDCCNGRHGYAALRLLERGGLSVTALEDMYDMLCTIDTWWRENRSYDGGVSFFCAYPFECGDVKSSATSRGSAGCDAQS